MANTSARPADDMERVHPGDRGQWYLGGFDDLAGEVPGGACFVLCGGIQHRGDCRRDRANNLSGEDAFTERAQIVRRNISEGVYV